MLTERASSEMRRGPTPTAMVIRLRLFAGSYAPLFVMLALRFDGEVLRISVGAAGALFLADTARLVLWQPRHVAASPYRVTEVRDHGSQVAGYLATYLLPLLVVPTPSLGDLLAYGLFFVVVAVVYVRSEMLDINPTLYVLGLRVLEVSTAEGWAGYAIVRSGLAPGDVLHGVHVDAGVVVEARR
jgi:hypothetical protein